MACPGKFNTQNGESHGDNNNCRSRRHDHHNAYQHDRYANDADHDATGRLIGEVHDSLDQKLPHWYCICGSLP